MADKVLYSHPRKIVLPKEPRVKCGSKPALSVQGHKKGFVLAISHFGYFTDATVWDHCYIKGLAEYGKCWLSVAVHLSLCAVCTGSRRCAG